MDQIEARHPVTSLATVSCRTDLLAWYERRGYRQTDQMPLDQVSFCLYNTKGRSYKFKCFSVIGTEEKM